MLTMKVLSCVLPTVFLTSNAFQPLYKLQRQTFLKASAEIAEQKQQLLQLLRQQPTEDPILVDPLSKESLQITAKPILGQKIRYILESPSHKYEGSSDAYINLLEPISDNDKSSDDSSFSLWNEILPLVVPPPLRGLFASDDYIPMRDLFTSPAVSAAYERGWRQGFRSAGFPGPDLEAQMAMDYFATKNFVVDMSCATGLFTRRFKQSQRFQRVIGCDYSDSMLRQAKQFEDSLELIRLDVQQLPFKNNTIPAMHAGAAMHCWPDLPKALSEIHRVLQPGGRYFATTFLSSYFGNLQQLDGSTSVSQQAFQYFGSTDQLRELLEQAGFAKIQIEVLGAACVVIRCEK